MASENLVEFTDDNWQTEVVDSQVPVLVDFWAPWCGPCRALGPTIDKIATQFAGKVKVGKLNVDDAPETATRYGVTSIPNLIFFKDGQVVNQAVGYMNEMNLTKKVEEVLSS